MADSIVATAVKGVAEIITVHGNVNIDYTDVHTVMHNSKVFIMGTGFASGEGRAMEAVNQALESPLLDSNDIYGTKNILLNIISGKEEIRIGEIGEIIETLQEKAGQEADIIWGNGYDESLGDKVCVTILATGFVQNPNQVLQPKPEPEKFELKEEALPETGDPKFSGSLTGFDEMEQKEMLAWDEEDDDDEDFVAIENEDEIFTIRERGKKEKSTATKRSRGTKQKKKDDQPVSETSVDNWFFKKFGKFFNDGDDQTLE
jgi:cell division protein FtsZ